MNRRKFFGTAGMARMNRLLTQKEVLQIANSIWPADAIPRLLEVSSNGRKIRIFQLGRDLTCELSLVDLAMDADDFRKMLADGWREAFWSDRASRRFALGHSAAFL